MWTNFEKKPSNSLCICGRSFLYLALCVFTIAIFAIFTNSSTAQPQRPQTAEEIQREKNCHNRSDSHVGDPFRYPLRVGALPKGDSLFVYVFHDKWEALPNEVRVSLLRDIACWYAGGRMDKALWYGFAAVDGDDDKVLENIPADTLWPGSSNYK